MMNDTTKHSGVNLRKSHPFLYHVIVTLVAVQVCLAINFWTSNPAFNPTILGIVIPKNLVGLVFFGLGVSQLVFLHVRRDLPKFRKVLTASVAMMLCWGLVNTQQFFAGRASLQLPIVLVGAVAVVQLLCLLEAPVNPMTKKS